VWFGSRNTGSLSIDGSIVTEVDVVPTPACGFVTALAHVPARDELWVGCQGHCISRFADNAWTSFDTSTPGGASNSITSAAAAPDGVVWFGTLGEGALRFTAGGFTSSQRRRSVAIGPSDDLDVVWES
jgi:sugar lactone lactonase YvrE